MKTRQEKFRASAIKKRSGLEADVCRGSKLRPGLDADVIVWASA